MIGQGGEVRPEDKAAAHALGLCLRAKSHGAFVRFKEAKKKQLKEKKLGHNSMAAKARRAPPPGPTAGTPRCRPSCGSSRVSGLSAGDTLGSVRQLPEGHGTKA